jgi:hypothetical protein
MATLILRHARACERDTPRGALNQLQLRACLRTTVDALRLPSPA